MYTPQKINGKSPWKMMVEIWKRILSIHGRLENVPFEDAFQGKTEIFQPAMLVYGSVDGGSMDFSPQKHGDVWEDKQNPQQKHPNPASVETWLKSRYRIYHKSFESPEVFQCCPLKVTP